MRRNKKPSQDFDNENFYDRYFRKKRYEETLSETFFERYFGNNNQQQNSGLLGMLIDLN